MIPTKKKQTESKVKKPIGVIASIFDIIQKNGPVSREQIHIELCRRFPERSPTSMKKTIQAQIGGKKRPCRMEKERQITFDISDAGEYNVPKK